MSTCVVTGRFSGSRSKLCRLIGDYALKMAPFLAVEIFMASLVFRSAFALEIKYYSIAPHHVHFITQK